MVQQAPPSRAVATSSERFGDGGPHHFDRPDLLERDEVDAVREIVLQHRGRGDCQPGLAAAPGTAQRHQPDVRGGDQRPQRHELGVATDDRSRGQGQGRHGAQALRRWKPPRQVIGGQLVEVLGLRNVLEPMPAQVYKRHRLGGRQPIGRLGDEHLPPVRARSDTGGPVHIHTQVSVFVPNRLTGVQPHANGDSDTVRPRVGSQTALSLVGSLHRIGNRPEHHEEAVSLGAHLMPVMATERRPHDVALRGQDIAVPVTEPAQQKSRPLDIAEQQRQCPGWKIGHEPAGPSLLAARDCAMTWATAAMPGRAERPGSPAGRRHSLSRSTAAGTGRPGPGHDAASS